MGSQGTGLSGSLGGEDLGEWAESVANVVLEEALERGRLAWSIEFGIGAWRALDVESVGDAGAFASLHSCAKKLRRRWHHLQAVVPAHSVDGDGDVHSTSLQRVAGDVFAQSGLIWFLRAPLRGTRATPAEVSRGVLAGFGRVSPTSLG